MSTNTLCTHWVSLVSWKCKWTRFINTENVSKTHWEKLISLCQYNKKISLYPSHTSKSLSDATSSLVYMDSSHYWLIRGLNKIKKNQNPQGSILHHRLINIKKQNCFMINSINVLRKSAYIVVGQSGQSVSLQCFNNLVEQPILLQGPTSSTNSNQRY